MILKKIIKFLIFLDLSPAVPTALHNHEMIPEDEKGELFINYIRELHMNNSIYDPSNLKIDICLFE